MKGLFEKDRLLLKKQFCGSWIALVFPTFFVLFSTRSLSLLFCILALFPLDCTLRTILADRTAHWNLYESFLPISAAGALLEKYLLFLLFLGLSGGIDAFLSLLAPNMPFLRAPGGPALFFWTFAAALMMFAIFTPLFYSTNASPHIMNGGLFLTYLVCAIPYLFTEVSRATARQLPDWYSIFAPAALLTGFLLLVPSFFITLRVLKRDMSV